MKRKRIALTAAPEEVSWPASESSTRNQKAQRPQRMENKNKQGDFMIVNGIKNLGGEYVYLEDILTWIKALPISFPQYICGEPMPSTGDALGLYILRREEQKPSEALTTCLTSYATCNLRLLIQDGETSMQAQRKAVDVYHVLETLNVSSIAHHKISRMTLLTQEPQPHPKDESGKTYEIDFSLTYER